MLRKSGKRTKISAGKSTTREQRERDTARRVSNVAVVARVSTYKPRISFSAIAAYETCPRMARYRDLLRVPELREAIPRFVGLDDTSGFATSSARAGSLAHFAL